MSVPDSRKFRDPLKRAWLVTFSNESEGTLIACVDVPGWRKWETVIPPGAAVAVDALLWDAALEGVDTPVERLARLIEAPGSIVSDKAGEWMRLLEPRFRSVVNDEWQERRALYRAVDKGLPTRVAELLRWGARPGQPQSDSGLKTSALERAVELGNVEMVQLMVTLGSFTPEEGKRASDVLRAAEDAAIRTLLTTLLNRFGPPEPPRQDINVLGGRGR
jgi:hypothetical protein